jgi:hypothetical protein
MTAVVGSRSGTGGTATRLAPSRPRPPDLLLRLRLVPCWPPVLGWVLVLA